MSEKMGLVTFEQGNRPLFLSGGFAASKEYSEETAREIDLEIKKIVDESFHRVKTLLTEKRNITGHGKDIDGKRSYRGRRTKILF